MEQQTIIIGNCDAVALAAATIQIHKNYPEAIVITADQAKEQGIRSPERGITLIESESKSLIINDRYEKEGKFGAGPRNRAERRKAMKNKKRR